MDFKNTIIELMGNTNVSLDLTGYIPQLETAINEGLKKATGGRISAYVCDTKAISRVADEAPLTGRRFAGSMFLDSVEYTYTLCFNCNNPHHKVYGDICEVKTTRAVIWEPLKPGGTNWSLDTLEEYRQEATKDTCGAWYGKLDADSITDIVGKAKALREALEHAKAKLLISDGGTRIVPDDTEIHYGNDGGFLQLDERKFAQVEFPYVLITLDDEYLVAPKEG